MKYYNIHTHNETIAEDVVSIYCLTEQEILDKRKDEVPNLYFSCGIHPWKADDTAIEIDNLRLLVKTNKHVVAIGEIGLDKLYHTSYEKQKNYFEEQIMLSKELDLPVIIHCVRAWDDLIQYYKRFKPSQPWIVHGFRGGLEQAKQLRKIGLHLSLGEFYNEDVLNILYPNDLLLETDESELSIQDVYNNMLPKIASVKDEFGSRIDQNVNFLFNFDQI